MILTTSFLNFGLLYLLLFVPSVYPKSCSKPAVRREWRALSQLERDEWISAIKCLSTLPHSESLAPTEDRNVSLIPPVNTSSTYYDDLVYVHMDLNVKIHFTGLFLPWHRTYVHVFEDAMKSKCAYNGTHPYWNWSLDAQNFSNSSILDPVTGFGGNGDPTDDLQIQDGPFSTDFLRAYPAPHNVRRNFTLQPYIGKVLPFKDHSTLATVNPYVYANASFDEAEVSKMVNGFVGDFESFQAYFEFFVGAHSGIHSIIAGDMIGSCPENAGTSCVAGPKWSSNDPLFLMHHAMVDKVWWDWQHKNKANFWSYHGGSVQPFQSASDYVANPNGDEPNLNFGSKIPMDGLAEEYTVYDVMDTTEGPLCYIYE